ncbi:MAG: EAL domain-containing protein [Pseudomonadales bacterium]
MTTSSKSHAYAIVRAAGMGAVIESMGTESYRLALEEFEHRLKQALRPVDKLIRLAPDKYCLMFHGVADRHHVELAAAKLERVFEPPADIIDEQLFFNINCGLIVPPASRRMSGKQLIAAAESALATAIRRNQIVHIAEPDTLEKPPHDPAMLPKLERALEEGAFTLFYQAKYDATYGNVTGAEGLVRWLDSESKKVIPPGAFIELVESSNLIRPLTTHLIKLAINRCLKWADPIDVAVNISPALLSDPQLVNVVDDMLSLSGLAPARLTLELTERGVMSEGAIAQLHALQEVGVKISIDDFGTGNCSLSHFRDLPADQLKIDQSFIRHMHTSNKDLAIINCCIELAHGCELKVVAEGVEDEKTAERLRTMNCDILQGYWFGKPMAAEDFELNHLTGLLAANSEPDYSKALLS